MITFARTLILARLLVPDDFGLLAIGWLTLQLSMSLTEFGMKAALIQRSDLDERHYDTAWSIDVLRASLVVALLTLAAPAIAALLGEPRAANVIRIMALTQVLDALTSIKMLDLARSLRFRPQAMVGLLGAVIHSGVAIGFAGVMGVWAVVGGLLCGSACQALASYAVAPHRPRLLVHLATARELFQFGRWILLTQSVASIGGIVLQVVVSRELGVTALGLYYLASRLALLPQEIVRHVVHGVMFPLHARLRFEPERSARAFRGSVTGTFVVLMPGYALLWALAPSLVAEVLGTKWAGTEPILHVLALSGLLSGLAYATMPLLEGRGWPQGTAALHAVRSLVAVSVAWGLVRGFGVAGAAFAWLAAELAVQIGAAVLASRIIARPFQGLLSRTVTTLSAAAAGAICALWLAEMLSGGFRVVMAAALGSLIAAAFLWAADRRLHLGIREDLVEAFPQLGSLIERFEPRASAPEGRA